MWACRQRCHARFERACTRNSGSARPELLASLDEDTIDPEGNIGARLRHQSVCDAASRAPGAQGLIGVDGHHMEGTDYGAATAD